MYLQKIMTLGLQGRLWPDIECLSAWEWISAWWRASAAKSVCTLSFSQGQCALFALQVTCRRCQSPLYNPSVLQPLLLLTSSFGGKATAVHSVCTLSNHTFLPKVRFPYVCSVINVHNLWQISLNSCFSCPSEQRLGSNLPKPAWQILVNGYLWQFPTHKSFALTPFGPVVSCLYL